MLGIVIKANSYGRKEALTDHWQGVLDNATTLLFEIGKLLPLAIVDIDNWLKVNTLEFATDIAQVLYEEERLRNDN